ncbi:MAG: hypothetical protein K9I34_02700 [Bacteroidales bacterium]|nr:hypothetical protein [Bacteroidales bacterium]
MKRIIINLSLVLSFVHLGYAQNTAIEIECGIGSYAMSDLENFNDLIFEGLEFNSKIVSNYPAYFFYDLSILEVRENISFALATSFNSTGSRISSQDYSGEYLMDSRIYSISPGLLFNYKIHSINDKSSIWLGIKGGAHFTKLNLDERLSVWGESYVDENYSFRSIDYYAEPGIYFNYQFNKFFRLNFKLRYSIQISKTPLKQDDNGFLFLNSAKISSNWSGIRTGLSLIYLIQ